jgi:uroporphyrinogen-III decarboxylase
MTTTASTSLAPDRLANFDFQSHNEEVKKMWEAFNARQPYRIPIVLGTNTRYFMFDSHANPQHTNFRDYIEDPDVMFVAQLRYQRWSRFNLLQDQELGLPTQWNIHPEFQNFHEAAWFGCPVVYMDDQVPDTHPAFADCPERVMEHGIPGPFDGIYAKALEFYERYKARASAETYLDIPIKANPPYSAMCHDGPLTVACNLFGPEFVCEAMIAEPERLETLLTFIVEASINRIVAWRTHVGLPVRNDNFGYADDSIALISTAMYREHILPHHRRFCDALAGKGPRGIHLCGDASRHFLTLRDELDVQSFDTGFPIQFDQLRRNLGADVQIQGGPHIEFLLTAAPTAVHEEVRRILTSGVLNGGRFLLREGNNLAPGTPLDNTEAMYRSGREFGVIKK